MHPSLHDVARLAASQHGVVSLQQAEELGVDRRAVSRAVDAGVAERVHPQVVAFEGSPATSLRAIHAAVLQVPSSVASHESSLVARGIDGVEFLVAVVAPVGSPNHYRGIRVHRFGDLLEHHTELVDGIPCTTIARTLVDLGSWCSAPRLKDLVDRLVIVERRTTYSEIAKVMDEVHHQGRRRIARLSTLLERRRATGPTPRSMLEVKADELVEASGLPTPIREFPLPSLAISGTVDRTWVDARLILEIDGRSWHAREQAMAKDRARDRAAAAEGWLVTRVLGEELDGKGADEVVAELVAIYHRRRADLRLAG